MLIVLVRRTWRQEEKFKASLGYMGIHLKTTATAKSGKDDCCLGLKIPIFKLF